MRFLQVGLPITELKVLTREWRSNCCSHLILRVPAVSLVEPLHASDPLISKLSQRESNLQAALRSKTQVTRLHNLATRHPSAGNDLLLSRSPGFLFQPEAVVLQIYSTLKWPKSGHAVLRQDVALLQRMPLGAVADAGTKRRGQVGACQVAQQAGMRRGRGVSICLSQGLSVAETGSGSSVNADLAF